MPQIKIVVDACYSGMLIEYLERLTPSQIFEAHDIIQWYEKHNLVLDVRTSILDLD